METLFPQGVWHYLAGGVLLGLAVSLAFALSGLVTGMSTVFTSTWSYFSRAPYFHQDRFLDTRQWRLALAVGLILGGALYLLAGGTPFETHVTWWQLLLGGFIAGFGARLGNGCTAGHGICGMASLQLPSALAVAIFLVTAMLTARLVQAFGGA